MKLIQQLISHWGTLETTWKCNNVCTEKLSYVQMWLLCRAKLEQEIPRIQFYLGDVIFKRNHIRRLMRRIVSLRADSWWPTSNNASHWPNFNIFTIMIQQVWKIICWIIWQETQELVMSYLCGSADRKKQTNWNTQKLWSCTWDLVKVVSLIQMSNSRMYCSASCKLSINNFLQCSCRFPAK